MNRSFKKPTGVIIRAAFKNVAYYNFEINRSEYKHNKSHHYIDFKMLYRGHDYLKRFLKNVATFSKSSNRLDSNILIKLNGI